LQAHADAMHANELAAGGGGGLPCTSPLHLLTAQASVAEVFVAVDPLTSHESTPLSHSSTEAAAVAVVSLCVYLHVTIQNIPPPLKGAQVEC